MSEFSVKIIGAGSIGNHFANAARYLGWDVVLCDVDPEALTRTKNDIYPSRYGKWDPAITLCDVTEVKKHKADLIIIGTPPDSHVSLAVEAIKENPKAILIEKPLCGPDLGGLGDLHEKAKKQKVQAFIGYDHVVSEMVSDIGANLKAAKYGRLQSLDVEFRENWVGIFNAHPWLSGPSDTYLGYSERGGGALGEHSHAINLWQNLALMADMGRVVEVSAMIDQVEDDTINYDRMSALNLKTEGGLMGRCIQDVITLPAKKEILIQGDSGAAVGLISPSNDSISESINGSDWQVKNISKTRPSDFIRELQHIYKALKQPKPEKSPISLDYGMETMLVIAAAFKSNIERRVINIDYTKGCKLEALS